MSAVDLGQRIRTRRAALGMKQSDLAEKSGLSQAYISRLESGGTGERLDDLEKVAQALGCRLSYLVSETAGELLAEVQRTLPNGTTIAISFERIGAPGSDPADDAPFIAQAVAAINAHLAD